jgi:hypothetical protein
MDLVYVAHKYSNDPANIEKAKQITHDLQVADPDNCYITPLLCFGHLSYNEISYDDEMALCLALLGRCDKMIVASDISKGVQMEIDHCRQKGIPIQYLPP